MKKKLGFVVNSISGNKDKSRLPQMVQKYLNPDWFDVSIRFTEYPGHAKVLADEYVQEGYDAVIAAGGDGTVNEVAGSLCGTSVSLGIVPMGSGDGLARHLHIPLRTAKALRALNTSKIEAIDYGRLNGSPFFCTSGVGFDAVVSHAFANAPCRGYITYLICAIKSFFKYHPKQYVITIDGREIRGKYFIVTVANAAQYGNEGYIAPHASIIDGKLDCVCIEKVTFFSALPLSVRLLKKNIDRSKEVRTFQGAHIVIQAEEETFLHLDGESIVEKKLRFDIEACHQGLKVWVPHGISK